MKLSELSRLVVNASEKERGYNFDQHHEKPQLFANQISKKNKTNVLFVYFEEHFFVLLFVQWETI